MNERKRIVLFIGIFKICALFITVLLPGSHGIAKVDKAGINIHSDHTSHHHHEQQQTKGNRINQPEGERADDNSFHKEPPLVNGSNRDPECDVFYILVSTLDGKLSALDLHMKGSLAWSVQADSRPLYDSSLASMEMTHNGKKMRLIPSLDGALYQFDGDKVEAVPLSAETLLSSTYRLSDDSMIVGSKDMRNFGVDLHTGEVQFTCGSEGCSNSMEKSNDKPIEGGRVLLLTRSTQVVRSVDIKNGHEKWNFSVGQHQIKLLPSSSSEIDEDIDNHHDEDIPAFSTDDCWSQERLTDVTDYENLLQVHVPEGRIVALNKRGIREVLWEHKFESPIAKAWFLLHGRITEMSLFDGQHDPAVNTYIPVDTENESGPQPLLYIGCHNKLMYIQASPHFESMLTFTKRRIGHFIDPDIKVLWRPYLNTASVRTPIFGGNRPQITLSRHSKDRKNKRESNSLAIWNEDYPFDTGYFLYPEFFDIRTRRGNAMIIMDNEGRSWFQLFKMYWREVLVITMLASIIQILLRFRGIHHKSNKVGNTNTNVEHSDSNQEIATPDLEDKSCTGEYVSRFASDFDCLHCLGKGGFGVVFEAVNKVDDQHYAIKRTILPKSEEAKEKVLREVNALAKLDHVGIVRYFNSWVESPPAGWQEERDKSFQFSGLTGHTPSTSSASHTDQEQSHLVPSTKMEKDSNKLDAQAIYSYSFKELEKKSSVYKNSASSSSADAHNIHQFRQSGSGEFSVHSDCIETSVDSNNDSLFIPEMSNSSATADFTCDDESSPFSNYKKNPSMLISNNGGHLHWELSGSGDSVMFEATNNKPEGSSTSGKTENYSPDISVFKKSFVPEVPDSIGRCKQYFTINNHCTSDLEFIYDENNDRDGHVKKTALSGTGTKFFLYIQMQLYQKETLKDWLSNNTLSRDRHTVLDIFDQIVCAVEYVHSQALMHRDLKPSNIFFAADDVVKVGDFGLVTAFSNQQEEESKISQKSYRKHTAEVGTTLYMSPEQIAKRPYDLKIDIFSLGLILLELLIPFSTQMERIRTLQEAKKQVFSARFKRELPSESELVCRMTSLDPILRPTANEILEHPLLQEFAPTRIGARHRKRTVSSNSLN